MTLSTVKVAKKERESCKEGEREKAIVGWSRLRKISVGRVYVHIVYTEKL